MKRSFILAALAVSSSIAFAGGAQAQGFAADLMPPYEVTTIITSMGMRPIGRPAWRAGRYIVAAVDRNGREVNVVLDARDGQVIAVRPMAATDRSSNTATIRVTRRLRLRVIRVQGRLLTIRVSVRHSRPAPLRCAAAFRRRRRVLR